MIFSRASFTQDGQSESVCRGQPSGGFVFCQDFKSGLSDHLGVKEGFGLYLLKNCIVSYATPAAMLMAWSKYFMSRWPLILGMVLFSSDCDDEAPLPQARSLKSLNEGFLKIFIITCPSARHLAPGGPRLTPGAKTLCVWAMKIAFAKAYRAKAQIPGAFFPSPRATTRAYLNG